MLIAVLCYGVFGMSYHALSIECSDISTFFIREWPELDTPCVERYV